MLLSGAMSAGFSLCMILLNAGQAWDAARKYILFGMLRDESGKPVGAESQAYEILGVGEQVGGPMEDLSGPALGNFVKSLVVTSYLTSHYYDEFPTETWIWGCLQVAVNVIIATFSRFGVNWIIKQINGILRRRREAIQEDEGVHILRAIERQIAREEEKVLGPIRMLADVGIEGDETTADDLF